LQRGRVPGSAVRLPTRGLICLLLTFLFLALGACQAVRTVERERLLAEYRDPTAGFVQVDGVELHLQDEGQGPALLLLHGAGASLHTWDAWARELREEYRVLRVDLPPFGLTGPHPEDRYDPETYLALLDGLLDQVGVEEAVLVGNSMGGHVAARYAATRPDRVRALVLLAPAGYPQSLPWSLRILSSRLLGWFTGRVTPRWVVARAVADAYGDPDRIAPGTVDRYWRLLRGPSVRRGFRRLASEMDRLRREEPEWVREIQAPTLLLWGDQDRFVPPAHARNWLLDLPHGRVVLLEGVGHVPMEEVPEESLEAVRGFLEAHRGLPSAR
jgi:pimeloyl-ACP methyl ester carboxylesterase